GPAAARVRAGPPGVVRRLADLPVAANDELLGRQLSKAHRPEGVELRRRDPDLRSEAELAAVVEARRRVHDDAARLDLAREAARALLVAGDDRLGVERPEASDVVERSVEVRHDLDGH